MSETPRQRTQTSLVWNKSLPLLQHLGRGAAFLAASVATWGGWSAWQRGDALNPVPGAELCCPGLAGILTRQDELAENSGPDGDDLQLSRPRLPVHQPHCVP